MRKNKTVRRTLLSFLLIGTILAQMIAGVGIGETMQVAAQETEAGIDAGSEETLTEAGAAVGSAEPEGDMETVELTDENRYGKEFSGQPEPRYPAAGGTETLEDYIVGKLKAGETTIDVSSYQLPTSESGEFFKIVKNHPELFYIGSEVGIASQTVDENEIVAAYQVQYTEGMTRDQIAEMSAELETAAEKAVASAESWMQPLEKALAVHDYLALNCRYDSADTVPEISHTAYGALVEGTAVCDGYAGAYLYIMRDKLGINCRIVTSEKMNHAWNLIQLDEKWYHVDVTWDDPTRDCIGKVCHDNFLLSDSKISKGSPDEYDYKNHYAWDGDVVADSDIFDEAFWTDIRSAICAYNGSWYYSKYQEEGKDNATAVKIVKRDRLLDGEEAVVEKVSAWKNGKYSYYDSSFLYLVKSGDQLYYNTSTEIRRIGKDGRTDGRYSLKDKLGNEQIFGFTMKDGDFLYIMDEWYPNDIRRLAAADVVFKPLESSLVDNPTEGKWSYIYFGSYPQTEVKGRELTHAIKTASYDINGDATVDGIKYRRIYTVRIDKEKKDQYLYFKWEPIRWRVLQKTDDTLLVMSDIGLDNIPYNTESSKNSVVWEESQIRDWMNNESISKVYKSELYTYDSQEESGVRIQYPYTDKQEKVYSFYTTAFNMSQQNAIAKLGDDKIFLLSTEDVKNEAYGFGTAEKLSARAAQASDYAHRKGVFYWGNHSLRQAVWWFRPDSVSPAVARGVNIDGTFAELTANFKIVADVPAMYTHIGSDEWVSEETMLPQEKASAKEKLENYRDADDYRKAEQKKWTAAVTEGIAAIEQAESVPAVKSALKTAIEKIDALKTNSDYRAEERGDIEAMDLNPKHHCNDNGDEDTTDWQYIYFGSYPQSKVTDDTLLEQIEEKAGYASEAELNGEKYIRLMYTGWYKYEPMKWKILRTEEDAIFVVADKAITMEGRNDLDKYLNGTFLEMAFDAKEQEDIIDIDIFDDIRSVYLLSVEEASYQAYGFCKDGTKASASRQIEQTEYCASRAREIRGLRAAYFDGWWLRDASSSYNNKYKKVKVNTDFISDIDNDKGNGAIEECSSDTIYNYGYIVPALRVSKSGGHWSFEPDSGVSLEVTQAIETAISELESGYSQEDYSEDNWAKVQAVIDAAKEELEGVDTLADVKFVLDEAKEKIAAIPVEEGRIPELGKEPDFDSLFPEDVREELRDRTFKTIDDEMQAMYSANHELTIEVLLNNITTCVNSKYALQFLQQMGFSKDQVDIFAIGTYNESKDEMRSYAEKLNTPDITYCYDERKNSYGNRALAQADLLKYAKYYFDKTSTTPPMYVFRDKNGKLLQVVETPMTTAQLAELLTSIGYGDLVPEDKKSDSTTIEAEFNVTYNQTEARKMLSRINEFRTGDGAWEWNSTNEAKIYHTDLDGLIYDYELEKAAMQRAAELVAAYSHTRPDQTRCFTAYPSVNMMMGENIAIGSGSFPEKKAFTLWREEDELYSGQGHRRNMLRKEFQTVGIALVTYNGCSYWVQEFGGEVVSDEEIAANDSETTVNVLISKDIISTQDLKAETETIEMNEGESQPLPQVYNAIRTTNTWVYAPSLELPVIAEWSVSSGEDVVSISEGALYALKEGRATVTASYSGKTTAVQVTVARSLTSEDVQEMLKDYESKLEDYGETEKAELEKLLETIKGEVEAALAEGDLEAAEAALARMEAALEEKAAGKKEEAKQELEKLEGSIDADEELDADQREMIKDVLREAETAIENAEDATAVKETLADAQKQIDEIKNMSQELWQELKQEKQNADQQISIWNGNDFLSKYGEAEQTEIKKITDKLAADMKGKTKPEEIQALLNQAKAEVEAIKTEAQKEEQAALNTARGNALEELKALEAKLSEYRAAEQEKIRDAIAAARTAIESAANENAVSGALEAARQVFGEQKTDAQLKQEEQAAQAALNTARGNALEELETLEAKLSEYRAAEQEKIRDAIAAAKTAIEAAGNADAVSEALEAARQVFGEQKTDAQLKQEEADKNNQGGQDQDQTPEASLSLDKTNATLYTGQAFKTVTVKATVIGGTSQTVIWTTSNPEVATVKDGEITAVGKGTAIITATANEISKTVEVTVEDPAFTIKKGSKKFTKSKLTVKIKKKAVLTVAVSPENSGISIAKLTAKQKKIASVKLKGSKITIKGKKKGAFTLQIKSGEAIKKIKIMVK